MVIAVTIVHVIVCIGLILVVLLQTGKGAEIGAVFGGGSSSTIFGSSGAGNFDHFSDPRLFRRTTAIGDHL
jgi:preprotein translocase subunit SecG